MTTRIDVAIVGGGIAGLYCAHQLSQLVARGHALHIGDAPTPVTLGPASIHVFESSDRFGGRIDTWSVDLTPGEPFRAEFGPMRIEPRDQPILANLLDHLGIGEPRGGTSSDFDLTGFSPYAAEEPLEPKFTLTGEEAEQHSLIDLLLLAIRRICELVAEEDQHIPARPDREAARYWRQFLGGSSVRRRYWKGELRDWIMSLDHDDYDHIRRGIRINGVYLRDMGFWNLLSEVLSHLAVLRIRDWGSYYHLVSENPNAAEHLIMWLRSIKSTNALRGIRGGMQLIVSSGPTTCPTQTSSGRTAPPSGVSIRARAARISCRIAACGSAGCSIAATTSTTISPPIVCSRSAFAIGAKSRSVARSTSGGRDAGRGR